jgi:hypothetical protein
MSYKIIWCYLWVFIPKTMPDDVERVAAHLGPPVEQVAFPFDATKRAKMSMGTLNNVIEQNIVKLSCRLPAAHLSSFLSGISSSSERLAPIHSASLVGSQHKDRVSSTKLVRQPCRLWVQDIIVNVPVTFSWRQGPFWLWTTAPCLQ